MEEVELELKEVELELEEVELEELEEGEEAKTSGRRTAIRYATLAKSVLPEISGNPCPSPLVSFK